MLSDVWGALLQLARAYDFPAAGLCAQARDGGRVSLPATPLAHLGDAAFAQAHGLRFNYMAGAMANGIASVPMVAALAEAGLLGVYGAAGQSPGAVAAAITALQQRVGERPFGVNLIHSPAEPQTEMQLAELLIERGVRVVEASAFLQLGLPVVRYRLHGIHRGGDGRIVTPNRVIAKVSRVEVATPFLSPAPAAMLDELVRQGHLTPLQRELAQQVPVASDLTAEADSGGHTDNRPQAALLPTMLALAGRLQQTYGYAEPLRVGAAGGLATPAAVAGAFATGAAYVVTGSVNQSCVEAGTSDSVRAMLAQAGPADIAMAPAADMFEMGVKVQVLKQGTMFPMRAQKLYELYQKHRTLDDLPAKDRVFLEEQLFREPLDDVWAKTKAYFATRDPVQGQRGEQDLRHRMSLVFRSYLGQASHWANQGVADRRFDYQVWCGPAMGAFNEWAKGSFLAAAGERRVVNVALNLLFGAAVLGRLQILRAQGAAVASLALNLRPLPDEQLLALMTAE